MMTIRFGAFKEEKNMARPLTHLVPLAWRPGNRYAPGLP
jgi:hypothetical protein